MIEKYIPTKENVRKFLQKIELRVKQNNQKPWSPQNHEVRL